MGHSLKKKWPSLPQKLSNVFCLCDIVQNGLSRKCCWPQWEKSPCVNHHSRDYHRHAHRLVWCKKSLTNSLSGGFWVVSVDSWSSQHIISLLGNRIAHSGWSLLMLIINKDTPDRPVCCGPSCTKTFPRGFWVVLSWSSKLTITASVVY